MSVKSVALTGASGFIGGMLVPLKDHEFSRLLLVGRDTQRLNAKFSMILVTDYFGLPARGRDFDVLVHLAAVNNNSDATAEEFRVGNIMLLNEVIASALSAGIPNLVNVTSLHALTPERSAYAASKSEALALARASNGQGIAIQNLFLPAVYGERFAGRLAFLNAVPRWARRLILPFLSAVVPTLDVRRLAHHFTWSGLNKSQLVEFVV